MSTKQLEIPVKKPRLLLPDNLIIDSWDKILPYFEELKNREITSVAELKKWLIDKSELEAVLEEDAAWRYIKMNIDTTDKSLEKDFHFFISEIEPKVSPYFNEFNIKLINSPFVNELSANLGYHIYLRKVKKQMNLKKLQVTFIIS